MIYVIVYFVTLFLATGYILWREGAPERWVAGLFVAASVATALVPWDYFKSFTGISWGIFGVDLLVLVGLIVVALYADRFWPIWLAALQCVAIGIHGVRAYDPHVMALAYWLLSGKLAYPMIAILVAGAARHALRLRKGMPEYAWTLARWRDERAPERRAEVRDRGIDRD